MRVQAVWRRSWKRQTSGSTPSIDAGRPGRIHPARSSAVSQERLACHTCDKEVADGLVEEDLHGNARVGARQHRGKWFLLEDRLCLQDFQVVRKRRDLSDGKALMTCN